MELKFDQEEIREAVINKCVDEILGYNEDSVSQMVTEELRHRVNGKVSKTLDEKIEALLQDAMTQCLNEEITPVNTWGEKVGEPTTLKAAIHERARDFWTEKVNGEGKSTNYGGKPRWEHLMGTELREAFSKAISQNITNIAGALKDAVRKDFYGEIDKGLNDLFKVNSKVDQERKKNR